MEWQGLSDSISDGADWSDYAYIRTYDLKSGKLGRYTDSAWAKKLQRGNISIFNLLDILTPSESEKFLEEEGHCNYFYDKNTTTLKILRRSKNSHEFCDPHFWPHDTPADIRSKFCCQDCVFEYGEDLAPSSESSVIPGLMTDIYRCILFNKQLMQQKLESYICPDESLVILHLIENHPLASILANTPGNIAKINNDIINKIGDIIYSSDEFKFALKTPFF